MKIVIVGGGTAGWLSALMISKVCKNIHSVTLIESSKIKTIGVGEGSTGLLRGLINNETFNFELNELDFIKHCEVTPKLGINFKNWGGVDYFEPLDGPIDSELLYSYPLFQSYISNKIPAHLSSVNGRLNNLKLSPFYINDMKIVHDKNHAYHFDSLKAAEYFKLNCENNIKIIDSEVADINISSNGIVKSLVLSSGQIINGDFFIDCSGFKRIFSEKMNNKFIKYEELRLNAAIPFTVSPEVYSNTNFYTTSWAHNQGWLWMIPKKDIVGCGYIYDESLIDEEKAIKEIENSLKIDIEFNRKINFYAGKLENSWVNNVLSVGLSFGFFEPLEATSIHGTIAQLNTFIFFHLKNSLNETLNSENIKKYNKNMNLVMEDFKNFILLHYALKNVKKNEFWIEMSNSAFNNDYIKYIIELSNYGPLSIYDVENSYGSIGNEPYNWVLHSLGFLTKQTCLDNLKNYNRIEIAKHYEKSLCYYIESKNWIKNDLFFDTI